MLEWTNWKRACEDQFRNNPACFPNYESKVNWSLTYLDPGPRDSLEKHFSMRGARAITWESLCTLLLEYLSPTETCQQATRLAFAKYKQEEDQSFKDYTEQSNNLASQLPNKYFQE